MHILIAFRCSRVPVVVVLFDVLSLVPTTILSRVDNALKWLPLYTARKVIKRRRRKANKNVKCQAIKHRPDTHTHIHTDRSVCVCVYLIGCLPTARFTPSSIHRKFDEVHF